MKQDILSLNLQELQESILSFGAPKFRSKQVFHWLHVQLVSTFAEMTNLPKDFLLQLENSFYIPKVAIAETFESKTDGTIKFLYELSDGSIIETVFMPYEFGNTVCISSQVGCKMGCAFCASGLDGFFRNLQVGELLGQVYQTQKKLKKRVSHVVVMGTGEPLDNYDNLVKFIKQISNETGQNLSQRHITVSTCGIIPKIKQLADEKLQITLALSLHATTNKKRASLMPIANTYDIEDTLNACFYYFEKTGRRVSIEYSLIKGQNDTDRDAMELISLLKGKNCHVNIIPVNPVKELNYTRPSKSIAYDFKNKLEKNGINVTIRREMGVDIDGACGQLRRKFASHLDS